ncbi:DUF4174 domain-containing protein [Psychroserpens burtonensis]|nr:DUF4174 domain-containing protein [Psychroserpens burtonensis]
MNAQDLLKHQWKDRVLLIATNNTNTPKFQNQLKTLQNQEKNLKYRKLIIYQITPSYYSQRVSEENKWTKRPELYQKMKTNDNTFEVILIGLDGGEKLRQNELLTTNKLFAIIDGMPMRRAETGNKN